MSLLCLKLIQWLLILIKGKTKYLQRPSKFLPDFLYSLYFFISLTRILQPHWSTCCTNVLAMLMPQGLSTYHSSCLVHFSFLCPHNSLPLGVCSFVVCSSVTFSLKPYMKGFFKVTISIHFSTLYYPSLLNFSSHHLSIYDMLYILLIYFVFPTIMYIPLAQGFYLFLWCLLIYP